MSDVPPKYTPIIDNVLGGHARLWSICLGLKGMRMSEVFFVAFFLMN